MLKTIIQSGLSLIGLQLRRLPPSPTSTESLTIGTATIRCNSYELAQTYQKYPENNLVIGRICRRLASSGEFSIIDIGANCGDTLAIAKAASPFSDVLCIEGDPTLAALLKENAQQFDGIQIASAYLGEKTGQFNVAIQKEGYNNTLVVSQDGRSTAIQTLDQITRSWPALAKLRFIKCDTEGYDVRILFGASDTLNSYHPVLLFEYNREAMSETGEEGLRVFSFLAAHGYDRVLFYDTLGRFLLSANLTDIELLQELHDYADGPTGQIYYYDILAFSKDEPALAEDFLSSERRYRRP